MISQEHCKVRVMTEEEFWAELRQFKLRQLCHWNEELRRRRSKTEGLTWVSEEFAGRMNEIQAVQENELAELLLDQVVDNSIRLDQLEYRFLGVIVWLVLIVLIQAFIIIRSGIGLF